MTPDPIRRHPREIECDLVPEEWPYINFAHQSDGRVRVDVDAGDGAPHGDKNGGRATAYISAEAAEAIGKFLTGDADA